MILKKRSAEEFSTAIHFKNLSEWRPGTSCGICGYQTGYIFTMGGVVFDPGCYCVKNPPLYRTWEDVARFYNMQTHPGVIAGFDAFWGFKHKPAKEK